jgi:hypothetical protein
MEVIRSAAMPFDANQSAIIQKHLADKRLVCPVCANVHFQLIEVTTLPVRGVGLIEHPNVRKLFGGGIFVDPKTGARSFTTLAALSEKSDSNRVFPVAIISCTNCFYVMQFSWMPILEQATRG